MKENSKKILLLLYPGDKQLVWLNLDQLARLLPKLSRAGLLSALFLLDKKDFLRVDKTSKIWKYSLSSYGKSYLEDLFPALCIQSHKEQASWSLVVFLSAPNSDRNFRYLRSYLTQNKAIALTRAVYLYSGSIPDRVKTELVRSYKNAVIVLKISEWIFGDDFKVIGQKAGLSDLFDVYSGISKELERLLRIKAVGKEFTQQENSAFFSVLDRFLDILHTDEALLSLYFPDVENVIELLKKFRKCLQF